MKLLFLSLFPILLSCGKIAEESNNSVFQNISLILFRNSKLTVSGTAVKGIVKNGIVVVNPLNADGTCNTAKVLASGITDSNGDYSLTYLKTGSFICVTVSGESGGNTKMYDEKENADISLAPSSNFKLVTVIPEGKFANNARKNQLASPFSSLVSRRLQTLAKQSGASADLVALNRKASKEVVIRFGLSSGLSSVSGRATTTSLNDNDYPELDDLAVDLKNPSDSLTAKNFAIMAGISYLANKTKAGTKTTPDDIATVMNAFATDFEDGLFDGKGSDGKAITMGTGASQITLSSTPLTTTLLPAIVNYIKEGGSLTVGLPNTNAVTITAAQVTSQIQFADYANIVFTVDTGTAPSNLTYPGAPFTFQQNAAIPTTSPVYSGGAIESCVATPTLPSGLSLSNTCAISGIPTATQDKTNYTITAANAKGSTQTTISILVSYFQMNWNTIQSILQAQSSLGKSATETANTTTITGLGAGSKWNGGVLAPNGKIYGIPWDATNVLIIDPSTNTADTTSITGLTGGAKWYGGVLAPNGKIYGIPVNSTSVLIIDPTTNTANTTTITGLSGSNAKWYGGVLAPNGKIYGIPRYADNVLIIDPTTNTADTTTITGLTGAIDKWTGGVLAPNGKIYGIPSDATSVLIIDPTTNTADTTTITGLTGIGKWVGGVLAPNGKIYGIPVNATNVLILDPITNTADTTTITGLAGTSKWVGGVLAPNGKIYGIPLDSTTGLILDPTTNTADTTTITGLTGTGKWVAGVLAPNGKIYGIPWGVSYALILDPKSVGSWPSDFYLSPFFNKL